MNPRARRAGRASLLVPIVGAGTSRRLAVVGGQFLLRGRSTYEESRTVVLGSGVRRGERRRGPAHDADEQRLELHVRRQRECVRVYDDVRRRHAAPRWIVAPLGGKGASGIRTGLLPAFAVFDAKGKEGDDRSRRALRLRAADPVRLQRPRRGTAASVGGQGHDCFGAQIDMRQVYLTVGGTLGPDPRRSRARPVRPAEHPERPDPVRRRRHRRRSGRRHHARPHRLRVHLSAVQGADDLLDPGGPAVRSSPSACSSRPRNPPFVHGPGSPGRGRGRRTARATPRSGSAAGAEQQDPGRRRLEPDRASPGAATAACGSAARCSR